MRKPNTNVRIDAVLLKRALMMQQNAARRDDVYLPDGDFPLGLGRGTIARRAYMVRLLERVRTYRWDAAHIRSFGLPEHMALADELVKAAREMLAHATRIRLMNR